MNDDTEKKLHSIYSTFCARIKIRNYYCTHRQIQISGKGKRENIKMGALAYPSESNRTSSSHPDIYIYMFVVVRAKTKNKHHQQNTHGNWHTLSIFNIYLFVRRIYERMKRKHLQRVNNPYEDTVYALLMLINTVNALKDSIEVQIQN